MKTIRYIKYNKTRREEFQIKTSIVEEGGVLYAEKSALRREGITHIRSFKEKYDGLRAQNEALKLVEPLVAEDGRTARFAYLTGETLAEELGRSIRDGRALLEAVREALGQVFRVKEGCIRPYEPTPECLEVFGPEAGLLAGDESHGVTNIDALFENILVTEDGLYCLDYEWVFSFPIPLHFVQYRTLYYFYMKYQSIIEYETPEAFLQEFGITAEMTGHYQAMERCFQDYVHGENQQLYLLRYMHETKSASDLPDLEKQIADANEHIKHLDAEIKERDTTIQKMQEIKRLTDNHVTNLEIIIGDLRRENGNMAQTLAYLNRHEALAFKVYRKLGRIFNEIFPKGTRRRKILSYGKNTVLHPIQSCRLFFTAKGRNLIEGDLRIGESYRIHGKLVFPVEEHPTVSVVIPAYNQIDYTYSCLVSILEHTKDVSYEVIIADDVSTDATAQLGRFTEHVTLCRNETNQGFLRNCNHAASMARGRYIMFLNNDTQVTPGWLSSLVDLIESDPSIGMAGSKLVYPDGRLQEAGGIIWRDGSGWNYGRGDDPDKPEYNYVKDVDYISGAAILLPRELWEEIGGFDERYAPAYCEDSDLAFEVRRAGRRVVYQPLSKVIHFEGVSNGTDVSGTGLKRCQVENGEKLKSKWARELKAQCVNTGNPDPFRARERSMGKRIILVVDHYVPTYDKDAGSKTTFQYLKMFVKKGFVVKFLGDNFLHDEPYSTTLMQMGIEILYGQDYQAGIWDWLKAHGGDIAVAYLNRPHIATKYVDFIRENTDIKVIYYGHDLHFLREGREYQLTGDPAKKEASEYWRSVEFSLMRKAAVSYYPSYIERDAIHAVDPSIHVKAIVAYVYEKFLEKIEEDFSLREGLLFVGGFAHPPNADAVLWFAREVYPKIRERIQEPFYIVGSKVTEEIKALESPDNGIIVKGFVSEEELASLYGSCRVVVVPLRYGAGVKGKVVEALYHGAPIVTTSIGAEGIPEAESVMVVRDEPGEFAAAVADLCVDEARCAAMCRNTQAYIKKNYSMEGAWQVVEEDFTLPPLTQS